MINPKLVLKQVGDNCRQARRRLAVSQEELGFATGFDRTYISGIERGVRNPSILALARLASGLNVSVAELVSSVPPGKEAKR